ncbi:MAG: MarC family protein [Thermoplasmata archaeon]|nr:MAG: MarC family protein [Thermoplasmata archaeon]
MYGINSVILVNVEVLIYVITSLFIIMDPPGALPLIIRITEGLSKRTILRLAIEVTLFVLSLIVIFALAGKYILEYFGITIPSLKVAGGIMLAVLGFEMMKEGEKPRARKEAVILEEEALSNALVPLGSPMLAGPGTLSLAIIYSTLYGPTIVIIGALVNALILFPIILFASYIGKIIGERGVRVFTRVLGFFVLALAVQYVFDGVLMYVSNIS